MKKPRRALIVAGIAICGVVVMVLVGLWLVSPNAQTREIRNVFDGTVTHIEFYENDNGRQIKHGLEIVRSKSGQKLVETPFAHGEKDGEAVEWYPDGFRKSLSTFDGGVLNGRVIHWHSHERKSFEGDYRHGKPNGKHVYWDNGGRIVKQEEYRDGTPDGEWVTTDASGKKEQSTYKNGVRDGTCTTYYANGLKLEQGNYQEGRKSGVWNKWHENGERAAQGEFRNDIQEGDWIFWYDNGAKQTEGKYRDGEQYGFWSNWDTDGNKLPLLRAYNCSVQRLAFTSDSRYLFIVGYKNYSLIDLTSGLLRSDSALSDIETRQIKSVVPHPTDSSILVTSGKSYPTELNLVDFPSSQPSAKHITFSGSKHDAPTGRWRFYLPCFSPDGRLFASVTSSRGNSTSYLVSVWDFGTRKELHAFTPIAKLNNSGGQVVSTAFSPDGRTFMFGTSAGQLNVCDLETGQITHTIKEEFAPYNDNRIFGMKVASLNFIGGGETVMACLNARVPFDGSLYVVFKCFDTNSWEEIRSHRMPGGSYAFAISPDESRVVFAIDSAIRTRDLATWRETVAYGAPWSNVTGLQFSPNGRFIAIARLGELQLWDAGALEKGAAQP